MPISIIEDSWSPNPKTNVKVLSLVNSSIKNSKDLDDSDSD